VSLAALALAAALATAVVTTTLIAKHISAANAKRDELGANAAKYTVPIFAAHAVSAEERSGSTQLFTNAGKPNALICANNANR
tara:strand:+ start:151 stop:399 length:249 start_codon:yes stop_codon:yes gene_type:complete